jgi:PKD repeat protein
MPKKEVGALAWLLPILALAMLLVAQSALPGSFDPGLVETAAGTSQFDQSTIFEQGTTFSNHSLLYFMPAEVRDMALGDLNHDGRTDVVVANRTSLFIYYGSGDGSLLTSPTVLHEAGMAEVRRLAIGDLDNDNLDDIAVTYTGSSGSNPKVTIFYQAGGFTSVLDINTYPEPYQVVIGRFDNTAYNGLAVACKGNGAIHANITLIQYPFTNAWNSINIPIPSFSNFQLLSAGYNDPDGRIDLVAGNMGGANVLILTQPASFSSNWDLRTLTIGGALTDIQMVNSSGNGVRDLAVVNSFYNRIEIRANNGTAIRGTAEIIDQVMGATSLSFGSVTGAALPDLSVISSVNADGRMYPHLAGGLEQNTYSRFPVNEAPLRVLTLDRGTSQNGLYVLSIGKAGTAPTLEFFQYVGSTLGNADGNRFIPNGQPSAVYAGNVSFDVVASILNGQNSVYVSNLAGTASVVLPAQNGPSGLYIGDLDGDGIGDLAVINQGSGSVSIYKGGPDFMTRTTANATITLNLAQPQSLTGGRLGSINQNALVIGCRDGIEVIYDPLSTPVHEELGTDISGDRTDVAMGRLNPSGTGGDIVALNKDNGRIDIFYAKATGTIGDCYNLTSDAWLNLGSQSPRSITVGDFDNDGRDDVAASTSTTTICLFTNEVRFYTDFNTYTIVTIPAVAGQIRSADLNDDGLDDLLVSYLERPQMGLFLSKGPLGFVNPINVTAGGPANGSFAGDIDGDGRADILASSVVTPALSYWRQRDLAPTAEKWLSAVTLTEGGSIGYDASNSTDSWSDRSSLQYFWSFGEGNISVLKQGRFSYLNSGTYAGYLLVTDREGLSNRTSFQIVVADIAPIASFTFEPDQGLENTTVWFNDTSAHYDGITAWRWGFGDGTYAYTQNATHKFVQDGTYAVWLNITEGDGDWSNTSQIVHVTDGVPTAGITACALIIDEGTTDTFYDNSISSPDAIVSYTWNFGDGSEPVNTRDAIHRFITNGTYNVTLTIIDSDGDIAVANVTITVRDTAPAASFIASKLDPLEGEGIILTDTSHAYDSIVSWTWELGDGRTFNTHNISCSFPNSGTYTIALTVVDADGTSSRSERTIAVQPTSPTLGPISAEGGQVSFAMDDQVDLQVSASPALVPIAKFAWDFDYKVADGFVETPDTSINQTSWSYHQPGEYVVCVRVYDSNSFTEGFLTIRILNVRPVASVTAQASQPGTYSFDASTSWDTSSDNSSLLFRWNFADGSGWTAWSPNRSAGKNYTADGSYSVILEVRDQWGLSGSVTTSVLVDNGPPSIVLDTTMVLTQAYRGDEVVVRVNVTDVSAIAQVVLLYTTDRGTFSMTMSRLSGTDIFMATIPTLNFTGPLTFQVVAEDTGGHRSTSTLMSMSVLVRPSDDWIYLLAGAMATILAILLFYFRAIKMVVDEVFFIYEDGNLIAHQTRRLKPGMDDQILGSMLVAIQNFVRDSFKDEASTGLNRMDFGEKKVLVEKGDHIYLAVVLHGSREGRVPQRMRDTIHQAEADFHDALTNWDGDLDKVRGIKDRAGSLLKGSVKDALTPNERGADGPAGGSAGAIEMIECPVCDTKISQGSTKCSTCGTPLATAGMGKLAAMADEPTKEGPA